MKVAIVSVALSLLVTAGGYCWMNNAPDPSTPQTIGVPRPAGTPPDEAKRTPPRKAASSKELAAASQTSTPAKPPDDLSDADPKFEVARRMAEELERGEEELVAALQRLRDGVSGIGETDARPTEKPTTEQVAKLVQAQRAFATQFLEHHRPFQAALERLRKSLEQAPGAYRQAASYYRDRADQEGNSAFQEEYSRLAANCDAYVRVVHERRELLDRLLKEVGDVTPFLEKVVAFLDDLSESTKLTRGVDDAEHRRASYAKLLTFANTLKTVEGTLQEYSRKLKERSLSPKVRREHQEAVAQAKAAEEARSARSAREEEGRQRQQFLEEFEKRRQRFLTEEEKLRERFLAEERRHGGHPGYLCGEFATRATSTSSTRQDGSAAAQAVSPAQPPASAAPQTVPQPQQVEYRVVPTVAPSPAPQGWPLAYYPPQVAPGPVHHHPPAARPQPARVVIPVPARGNPAPRHNRPGKR